jgi:hypothetical protein
MKSFILFVRIARRNKGMLYYYDVNGWAYSPCRDLYGQPVINFRDGKKYGKELTKKDCEEIKNLRQIQ